MVISCYIFSQKHSTIDFWLHSIYASDIIAQSLFRTHSNIYDEAFLQKSLTAKNR